MPATDYATPIPKGATIGTPIPGGATIGAPIPPGKTIGADDKRPPWERYAEAESGPWEKYAANDFQYVKLPDGSYGKFNAGVSDDVIRQTIIKNFPEAYAFAHPPVAPPVAGMGVLGRPAMPGVSSRYAGPQSVALPPIQRESRDKPMEVAKAVAPMAITMPFVGGPVVDAIATRSVEPLLPLARTLAKSYIGSRLGGYVGGEFGDTGRKIGRVAGGALGSISPDSFLERAPFGIGKMFFSDAPAEASPFEGMQSTSPESVSALPKISPQEAASPSGGPLGKITTSGRAAEIEMKGATPTKSLIQEPGSAPPGVKTTFQSYPRQQLADMIRDPSVPYKTKILALNELRRSPAGIDISSIPGAKYLMEEGAQGISWRNYRK